MNRFFKYFYVQIKRIFKILPTFLLTFLLTGGCIFFVAMAFMKNGSSAEEQKKIQIGVVGNISESYLGFGIHALKTLDDSRYMIDFLELTEEEAEVMLRQGKLSAYVLVPDGFVESLVSGRNDKPITYISSEGQKGIVSVVKDEIADLASMLVTRSQSAIYGMQNVLRNNDRNDILWDATDQLNIRFIEQILKRTDLCEVEIWGMASGLSTGAYYFCSILLFFLLILGINSSPLFSNKSREISRLLSSKGVSVSQQIMCEYLAYFCLTIVSLLVIFLFLFLVVNGEIIQIAEWKNDGTEPLLVFCIRLLPVAVMISSLQFLLYELATGIVSSILLQFICSISMGYLSGYFYPAGFFPDIMQFIGRILPTGVALSYTSSCVSGNWRIPELLGVLLYSMVFLGLTVLVRNNRIQRG